MLVATKETESCAVVEEKSGGVVFIDSVGSPMMRDLESLVLDPIGNLEDIVTSSDSVLDVLLGEVTSGLRVSVVKAVGVSEMIVIPIVDKLLVFSEFVMTDVNSSRVTVVSEDLGIFVAETTVMIELTLGFVGLGGSESCLELEIPT